jgi:hypothetical protein
MRTAVLLLLVTQLAACGVFGDRRDAPWDPKAGSGKMLFDQIPNNTSSANTVCCGHLRVCAAHQTPRC